MVPMIDEFEFRKWSKTKRLTDTEMVITQKMDGTNAQILFSKDSTKQDIRCMVGSRNKWLVDVDNFGFKAFVTEHYKALFNFLGPGRHYGEWCGPGIQTGEGLEERKLFLFGNYSEIPDSCEHLLATVPELYRGAVSLEAVRHILEQLILDGSYVNGFDKPEGIIVNIAGVRYKVYLDQLDEIGALVYDRRGTK